MFVRKESAIKESKDGYKVRCVNHANFASQAIGSLLKSQSLVDVAVTCGTNTTRVHKCILALNSSYFRKLFENNTDIVEIVFTGLDFTVIKSIVQFMYCGETSISDENVKHVIAAAKYYQIYGLQGIANKAIQLEADLIEIAPPLFILKKPIACIPKNNTARAVSLNLCKNSVSNDQVSIRNVKRKVIRSEADMSCAKKAAASRTAGSPVLISEKLKIPKISILKNNTARPASYKLLNNPVRKVPNILRKVKRRVTISKPDMSCAKEATASCTAVEEKKKKVQESCTEAIIENFIPYNLDHIENVPLQAVNYDDLTKNKSILTTNDISLAKSQSNNVLQFETPTNVTEDKLDDDEIIIKTSDNYYVSITKELMEFISEGLMEYQVVDENDQLSEVRKLQLQGDNIEVVSSNQAVTLDGENTSETMQIVQPQVVEENFIRLEGAVNESDTIDNNYNSTRNDAISALDSIAPSTSYTTLEKVNSDNNDDFDFNEYLKFKALENFSRLEGAVNESDTIDNNYNSTRNDVISALDSIAPSTSSTTLEKVNSDDNDDFDFSDYLIYNTVALDRKKDNSDYPQIESVAKDYKTEGILWSQTDRKNVEEGVIEDNTKQEVVYNWWDVLNH